MNSDYWNAYSNEGHLPWDYPGAETRTKELIQKELADAVEREDYERAAVLRDELKGM